MKILHVITTLDVGGAEMHLLSQVEGQARRGHEVRVLYLKGRGTLKPDFERAGAPSVEYIGMGPGTPTKLVRGVFWADVVHTHLLKADMLTAFVATLFGRRKHLIASKHNDEKVLQRRLVGFIHGILGNLPQRTIVLSDHVVRYFEEYGRLRPEKLRRIYYGLDLAPFDEAAARPGAEREELRADLGIEASDVVFTCIARFAPQKAHGHLIRSFARALAEGAGPGMSLLLVGDDPFGVGRERAEALVRELEIEHVVRFAGIRRDVPEILAASDALVMSSRWEGLGRVFLEAMASRLPVLATRISAIPEVVVEGETGLLVTVDDEAELAAAFLRLAGDEGLRQRLGEAGRRRVEQVFGLERMVDETLAVYAEVGLVD